MKIYLPQGVDYTHVLITELKVKDLYVLIDPFFLPGFGEDDEAMLKSPSQTNLSRCLMVLCSKASNDLVLHQLVIVSGKRRIGLNCDVVLSAEVNGLSFP